MVDNTQGTCYVPSSFDVRFNVSVANTLGQCYIPAASDVKIGASVDQGTGTYDPLSAAVWPGISNVLSGEQPYGPNGNDYQGTYIATSESDVKSGVSFGASGMLTGQYTGGGSGTVPDASDVRTGVAVGSGVGTCYVPAASDVRAGANVDNTVGTCAVPARSDVRQDVYVDGTYGTCAVPHPDNVRTGVAVDDTVGTYEGGGGGTYCDRRYVQAGIDRGDGVIGTLQTLVVGLQCGASGFGVAGGA